MATRAERLPAIPHLDPSLEVPEGLHIAYAQHLLNKHLCNLRSVLNDDFDHSDPLPQERLVHSGPSHGSDPLSHASECTGRVAIVGAGATGLYLAMMLKYLKVNNVDIYEASDRIGWRCYTYEFPKDKDCPHNYYDIGAMRIPNIPAMKSTLNLIEALKLPKNKYVLNAGHEPQMHYYSTDLKDAPKGTAYEARIHKITKALGQNWDEEFKTLVEGTSDNYSTPVWLMLTKPELTCEETEEAESAETSTGLFDQAFIKSLCDYGDFQAATGKGWYCMDGSPLQRMDIQGLVPGFGLPPTQKKILTGIRSLSYDRAYKIAIIFKSYWWKGMYQNSKDYITIGGVSSTDLSVSNIIYPSTRLWITI
ncbi:hypothetical protein ACKAV7_003777 [Fusarium commune]